MQSHEIRHRFLAFFEKRGHKVIPSASLVPENDPSVLFNTAGMQPLVPYLLGQTHPMGKRIVDVQKCVRTGDLEDIGDNRHFSFFEMMGNWSLGDYFKEEAITWSYEFLTSKEEGLGLDPARLYFTIFEGDENAPYDEESKKIWISLGIPENRIYALPADDNWWSPGDNGPCGPCSEMFYDMTGNVGDLSHQEFLRAVKEERVIEIWNDVFMEFEKKDGKVIGKLAQKNVDTGAGLERMTAVMQGKQTAYDTDILKPVMDLMVKAQNSDKNKKIIADHLRTSVFLIGDGVMPSNTDRGYVLRRLIRRAVISTTDKTLDEKRISIFVDTVTDVYKHAYPELIAQKEHIKNVLNIECAKFADALKNGVKEFEKILNLPSTTVTGTQSSMLTTSFGLPIELITELAGQYGKNVDLDEHDKEIKKHQELSRSSSAGMFKGGLANTSEKTVKLHTAHHLLLAALQQVLGKEVKQKGSNITEERLRIDFAFDRKMTEEEKKEVEDIVNKNIKANHSVIRREMPKIEAESIGAEMEFGAKYPDIVSLYFIEDKDGNAISKEFCGGPHVEHTGELGIFKIQKEEASSQGVRRIKAILQ